MATHSPGNLLGFVDKQRFGPGAKPGASVATPANYASNTALDTRLNAINGTLYSQANLDRMTTNDKVYALRLFDDASSV